MARHGVYAHRNAGHRERQARLFAQAQGDAAKLAAAYGWFRSSAVLLAKRRPPREADQKGNERAASALVRDMTMQLKQAAEAIDRGDHDTTAR